MSKVSIRHTLQAVAGAVFVALPLAMDFAKSSPKLAWLSVSAGFLLALFSNAKVVAAAGAVLDLFWPETPVGPVGPTGLTGPQKKDGGFVILSRAAVLMIAMAAFMLAMLIPKLVHAQSATQKYGGCLTPASYGQICVGPRAGALITRYDFSGPLSGKFTGGFQPGAGYGIILQSVDPTQNWKMIEFDVFGSAAIGGSTSTIPNNFALTGLFTVFNYVSLGGGAQWTEQATGSAKAGIYITGGLTFNIGGMTPAQTKLHTEQMKKAAEQEAAVPHN